VALTIALGWAAVAGLVKHRRLRRPIRSPVVECFRGPLHVKTGDNKLAVQGRWFRLPTVQGWFPKRFWNYLDNGMPYRVYVAPAGKRIVAMEPDGWA